MELAQQHCTRVNANTPALNEAEVGQLLAGLPGWKVYEKDGEPRLEKAYRFADFDGAVAFTDQVAAEANREDHHPAILTEWGKVTVTWWTHRIKGLHQNDFIMAARTDRIFGGTV